MNVKRNMLKYGTLFIGCFLCSRITAFKMTFPAAIAISSAFSYDVTGISGILGAFLGLLSLGTIYDSLDMFCCCLIITGIRIVVDSKSRVYPPIIAFVSVMFYRIVGGGDIFKTFVTALLAGVTAAAVTEYKNDGKYKKLSSILIYTYIGVALALNDFLGISVAMIIIMAAASYGVCDDLSFCVLSGALCGLLMSFKISPVLCAVMPILSAVCYFVHQKSRAISKALFFGTLSFTLALSNPATAFYRIAECLISYLISLALPYRKKKIKVPEGLIDVADTITSLEKEFENICSGVIPGGEADVERLCDKVCEKICDACSRRDECWIGAYSDTTDSISKASEHLKNGTAMTPSLLSGRLYGCIKGQEICDTLNEAYRAETVRKTHVPSLITALVLRDLASVNEVKNPSSEIVVSKASRTKGGERVSGDNVSVFSDRGRQIVILSDGMGSGEEARRYSTFVCDAVKKLVNKGLSPETALLLVGDMLGFAEGDWFVATDILTINLQTLEAELIKAGGAPSLLKRKNKFFGLSGSTLPLGVEGGKTLKTTIKLKEGDTLLLFSDGVTDFDENCSVITGIAKNCDKTDELPSQVISSLSQIAHDDMSVVAVTVKR